MRLQPQPPRKQLCLGEPKALCLWLPAPQVPSLRQLLKVSLLGLTPWSLCLYHDHCASSV